MPHVHGDSHACTRKRTIRVGGMGMIAFDHLGDAACDAMKSSHLLLNIRISQREEQKERAMQRIGQRKAQALSSVNGTAAAAGAELKRATEEVNMHAAQALAGNRARPLPRR